MYWWFLSARSLQHVVVGSFCCQYLSLRYQVCWLHTGAWDISCDFHWHWNCNRSPKPLCSCLLFLILAICDTVLGHWLNGRENKYCVTPWNPNPSPCLLASETVVNTYSLESLTTPLTQFLEISRFWNPLPNAVSASSSLSLHVHCLLIMLTIPVGATCETWTGLTFDLVNGQYSLRHSYVMHLVCDTHILVFLPPPYNLLNITVLIMCILVPATRKLWWFSAKQSTTSITVVQCIILNHPVFSLLHANLWTGCCWLV